MVSDGSLLCYWKVLFKLNTRIKLNYLIIKKIWLKNIKRYTCTVYSNLELKINFYP